MLRRPEDEAISLFAGLLANPDVPSSLMLKSLNFNVKTENLYGTVGIVSYVHTANWWWDPEDRGIQVPMVLELCIPCQAMCAVMVIRSFG